MLRIEYFISAEETRLSHFESETLHVSAVTLRILEPWFNTSRLVFADSYFASVETANVLFEKNFVLPLLSKLLQ